MNWEWWITTTLAAVAALGVVVNEVRHRQSRPVIDVRARAVKRLPFSGMRAFGEGEWLMEIRNFGTVEALDVNVVGMELEVFRGEEGPPVARLPPGGRVRFSATLSRLAPNAGGWVLLTYITPATPHGRSEWTWWPADETGELAAVRRRQLTRPVWKRLLARFAFPDRLPSPFTIATSRRTALSQAALTYTPGETHSSKGKMWRVRLVGRLMREPLPDEVTTQEHD